MSAATLAGIASTMLFVGSTLPMVVRATRTRDLSSYSRGHLAMTNLANAVHTVYVTSLPFGPVWFLHGVHVGVSAFMLAAHHVWARTTDTAKSLRRSAPDRSPARRAGRSRRSPCATSPA